MPLFSRKYLFHIRVLTRICLVVFISFKTISVIHVISSSLKKEVFEANESGNDETQKKTEKTAGEKEKEFALLFTIDDHLYITGTHADHNFAYLNHYQSSYFVSITIPPPDVCVKPSI